MLKLFRFIEYFLVFIVSIFTLHTCFSQCEIAWQKSFGGNENDVIRGGVMRTSFGYLIAGDSKSELSGNKTIENKGIWLIGIDSNANMLWQRGFCNDLFSSLWSFVATNDNNFILSVISRSDSCESKYRKSIKEDIWIVKINENGNILWEKTVSGIGVEEAPRLISTNDNGFLIGATSYSQIGLDKIDSCRGASDYWIIKLDSFGNIQWQKTFGGNDEETFTSLYETFDGYVIGGYSKSSISGDKEMINFGGTDYWILKLDKLGNIIWQNSFGGNLFDNLYSIIETDEKSIIIVGSSSSGVSGNKNVQSFSVVNWWVIKLDKNGNEIWQKTYGGNGSESPFVYLTPGKKNAFYLYGGSSSDISGNKTTYCRGKEDYWFLKLNYDGEILWQYAFGGNDADFLRSILIENDSCFILSGQTASGLSGDKIESSFGSYDEWVLKIKIVKNVLPTNQSDKLYILIYPNPTSSILYFDSNFNFILHRITNSISGSTIFKKFSSKYLDISELTPGTYTIEFLDKSGKIVYRKLINKI